ncbi:hypothetical protein R3P38DRAFT_3244633 [Favolaschia claudopus]|uniref:Uncharacterized protein n=1 Tax=Favolaschia claudopus TaxID=2862362 RepID=A0AAV9Z1H3_9AGAR
MVGEMENRFWIVGYVAPTFGVAEHDATLFGPHRHIADSLTVRRRHPLAPVVVLSPPHPLAPVLSPPHPCPHYLTHMRTRAPITASASRIPTPRRARTHTRVTAHQCAPFPAYPPLHLRSRSRAPHRCMPSPPVRVPSPRSRTTTRAPAPDCRVTAPVATPTQPRSATVSAPIPPIPHPSPPRSRTRRIPTPVTAYHCIWVAGAVQRGLFLGGGDEAAYGAAPSALIENIAYLIEKAVLIEKTTDPASSGHRNRSAGQIIIDPVFVVSLAFGAEHAGYAAG